MTPTAELAEAAPPLQPNLPHVADLALRIRAEHQAVVLTLRQSLAHALACGRLLIEARGQIPHGSWQKFVEEECDLSYRSVARYCRLASSYDALPVDQQEQVSPMSMRQALLYLMDSAEPEQAPDEGNKQYQVGGSGSAFLAALRACSGFVTGDQDSRHVLKGVHLVAGGRIIRMEAADGHRMFNAAVQFEGEVPAADVVIPADLVRPASPLFKSGPVTLTITEHEIEFSNPGGGRVSGRLLKGKYVALQEHLARILKNPRVAVVNVGLLVEAAKRTQLVTQHLPAHPLQLRFGQHERPDVLLVTDEAGHTDTEIEGVAWEGSPFTIMLKSDYLLNHLAQEPPDSEITLRFSDAMSPIGLVGADGRCGAILPLRPLLRPHVAMGVAPADPYRPEPVTTEIESGTPPVVIESAAEEMSPNPVVPEVDALTEEARRAPEMQVFDSYLRGIHLDLTEIEARYGAEHRLPLLIELRDRISAIIERVSPAAIEVSGEVVGFPREAA